MAGRCRVGAASGALLLGCLLSAACGVAWSSGDDTPAQTPTKGATPPGKTAEQPAKPAEVKTPSLEDDLKRLEGSWRTGGKAEPQLGLSVRVVRRDGRVVEASALYLPLAFQVPAIELKEVGKERVIEHKNPNRELGLTSVPYRFDGETLVLTVPEGKLKGEHKLTRVKDSPKGKMLTPDTMADHGFSITCRFTDQRAGTPARPSGLVLIQIGFDASKGPAINKTYSAEVVVLDGDAVLLSVPVQLSEAPRLKLDRHVQLSVHKDMLPKAQLVLTPLGFDPPPFRVDLGAFHKAAAGAGTEGPAKDPAGKVDTPGPRRGGVGDPHDLLPLLTEGETDANRVKYRAIVTKLEKGKVPTPEKAGSEALGHKLKAARLMAEEVATVTALLRLGVDVPEFADVGDLVWVVRISHLERGVTQETWVSARTGAIRTVLPVPEKPK